MTALSLTPAQACDALRQGRMILFPTETFWALGCDALDPDAVARVFALKKRSLHLPLPVVVAEREDIALLAAELPPGAASLMDAFWPGPLSIVLPARPEVPDLLTANAGRIAVRLSPHPAVRRLQTGCDRMILVSSSANVSGRPPVTDPRLLDPEILAGVAGIFACAPPPAGDKPSTVVDLVPGPGRAARLRILRPGAVSREALESRGFYVEDHCAGQGV